MTDKKYLIVGLGILLIPVILTAYTIAVFLSMQLVYGQTEWETKFMPCIIMWQSEQVVLEESDNCSTSLFTEAVTYYKSQGFQMTPYSNVFNQIMTLTKD